jgi:ABC-type sugar transport system ATPase subunit
MAELLRAIEVSKRFPGVLALDRVSSSCVPGGPCARRRERGRKSTLVNSSLVRFIQTGTIELEGRPVQIRSPTMLKSWGSALSSST